MKQEPKTIQKFFSQIVTSTALPKISVKVNSNFSFLGKVQMDVRGLATAEQYYFAKIIHGMAGEMFIIHFEHFHSDNDHFFDYPCLNRVRLGGLYFLQQAWAIVNFELFKIKEVIEFFEHNGLIVEPDWLVNRYVTVVDDAKKHELILFHLEPGGQCKIPLKLLQPGAERYNDWSGIENGLIELAKQVFEIIPS